jgi:hypothetical protein
MIQRRRITRANAFAPTPTNHINQHNFLRASWEFSHGPHWKYRLMEPTRIFAKQFDTDFFTS